MSTYKVFINKLPTYMESECSKNSFWRGCMIQKSWKTLVWDGCSYQIGSWAKLPGMVVENANWWVLPPRNWDLVPLWWGLGICIFNSCPQGILIQMVLGPYYGDKGPGWKWWEGCGLGWRLGGQSSLFQLGWFPTYTACLPPLTIHLLTFFPCLSPLSLPSSPI